MQYYNFPHANGNGYISVFKTDDVEYVNPVDYFFSICFNISYGDWKNKLDVEGKISTQMLNEAMQKVCTEFASEMMENMCSVKVPKALFSVLNNDSKKEQIRILKTLSSFTDSEFASFICNSYSKFGYKYSQYWIQHYPNGMEHQQMPLLTVIKRDERIESFGDTTLTDKQLKPIFKQRTVKLAKFLDNGDSWHCFFYTYNGIFGEEKSHKDGQPHMHYISNAWGVPREEVIKQLKSKNYKLPSLHIDFKHS